MKKKIQVFCKAIVNIGIIAIALFLSSCGMMKESFLSAFNENPVSTDENVSKSNLPQAVISNNTETKGNAYQETEKYVVTATYLNVREKASSKSVKVGGLSKGDQVEVYGFKGNWAEIGFKGGKAFVYKEYVEKLDKDELVAQKSAATDRFDNQQSFSSFETVDISTSSHLTSIDSYDKELQIESDGFKWYKLEQEGKVGAQSEENEETLIPISRGYDFISYDKQEGGWFLVGKNGRRGACNKTGKEIVAPIKYDMVSYRVSYRTRRNKTGAEYCFVYLDGKEGVCDRDGREIIPTVFHPDECLCFFDYAGAGWGDQFEYYKNGEWHGTNVCLSKHGKGLGHFRRDDDGSVSRKEEESRAKWGALAADFITTTLSNTLQTEIPSNNDPQYQRYLDYKNSGLPNASTITFEEFKRADARAAANGYSIDRDGNKGDEPTPGQKSKDCSICHGSGKCNSCNGSHRIKYKFGSGTLECPNCKPDGRCSHCKGSGKETTH